MELSWDDVITDTWEYIFKDKLTFLNQVFLENIDNIHSKQELVNVIFDIIQMNIQYI